MVKIIRKNRTMGRLIQITDEGIGNALGEFPDGISKDEAQNV